MWGFLPPIQVLPFLILPPAPSALENGLGAEMEGLSCDCHIHKDESLMHRSNSLGVMLLGYN